MNKWTYWKLAKSVFTAHCQKKKKLGIKCASLVIMKVQKGPQLKKELQCFTCEEVGTKLSRFVDRFDGTDFTDSLDFYKPSRASQHGCFCFSILEGRNREHRQWSGQTLTCLKDYWIIICGLVLTTDFLMQSEVYLLWLRLFTVLYFSVRSSRSSTLCYGLPSCMSVKTT